MDIEKMTTSMQKSLYEAQQIAQTRHHQAIEIPHLWRIFVQPNSFAFNFYKDSEINIEEFTKVIEKEIDKISSVEGSNITYGQNISADLLICSMQQIRLPKIEVMNISPLKLYSWPFLS